MGGLSPALSKMRGPVPRPPCGGAPGREALNFWYPGVVTGLIEFSLNLYYYIL